MEPRQRHVRYLLKRNGRFYARRSVPPALRPVVGLTELLSPLGADRRLANQKIHAVLAQFESILSQARRGIPPAPPTVSLKHAMHECYDRECRRLEAEHLGGDDGPPFAGLPDFEEVRLRSLQKIAFGYFARNAWTDGERRARQASLADLRAKTTNHPDYCEDAVAAIDIESDGFDTLVDATLGWAMAEAGQGKTLPLRGSKAWVELTQGLARALVEAIQFKRRGFTGAPNDPVLIDPQDGDGPGTASTSLDALCEAYIAQLTKAGRGKSMGSKCRLAARSLQKFVNNKDARSLTRADIHHWLDHISNTLAAKTVRDSYLAAANAILSFSYDRGLLAANPMLGFKYKMPPKTQSRPKGYSRGEAERILGLSRAYLPTPSNNPATRESAFTASAKRWVPLLCALTGARVAEITQLRRSDVLREGVVDFIRISPDAGSVKTNKYRDVPLHRQLIENGFLRFVNAADDGPLFFNASADRTGDVHPSKCVGGRVSDWLRASKLVPEGVKPNHGWRHSFKSFGIEAGIEQRVLDAIQGHAGKTAGERYGEISLTVKAEAMRRFPSFDLDMHGSSSRTA